VIRQGEIRDYHLPSARGRVVVVSRDEVSNGTYPIVVSIQRGTDDVPPFLVALAEHDPMAGTVDVARLAFADPDQLSEPIGLVSGDTWSRLRDAIMSLFDGP
jgi:mRNA-degrading endonuclease toxin of MazEF toxin-antitoxin module